jgi:hypothetical protein
VTVVGIYIWASPERGAGGIAGPGSYPVYFVGGILGNGVVAFLLLSFIKANKGAEWLWRAGITIAVVAMIAGLISALGAKESSWSLSGRALQWPGTVAGLFLGWKRRQKPIAQLIGQHLRQRFLALLRDISAPFGLEVIVAVAAIFFVESRGVVLISAGTLSAVLLFATIRSLGPASPGEKRAGVRLIDDKTGYEASKIQRFFRAAFLILWPFELLVLGFGSTRTLGERITRTRLSAR